MNTEHTYFYEGLPVNKVFEITHNCQSLLLYIQ